MKRPILFFLLLIVFSNNFAQTLFTYGNNAVSKTEFLRAYNKNKTQVTDKAKAMRDYLDLYIKFKLKVQAAKDLRLDTLASLKNDMQNFKSQIEESYLNDENRVNALMQEAFERSQKDIHVSFIFYPLKDFKDSVSVKTRHSLAKEAWTDLGYVTVFNLPYEMENIVYGLKPGEESNLLRTKNGYYIFKNIEERKAVGKIKAAQILVSVPEGAGEQDKINASKLADSIYHSLLAGADFGEMAKQFSNDKMTYMAGGALPEFGVGKYDPAFENTIFALQKDGDITQPFQTRFGYHIVKRLSRTGIPADKNDAGYLYLLKQQVQADTRVNSAKEKFVNDILKKLDYKKNTAVNETALWNMTDSFMLANKKKPVGNLNEKTTLFSLGNTNLKVSDWYKFIKDYRASGLYKGETDKELFNKYVSVTAIENYRNRLQDFNPEFKYQVQEFKEGNMLFEVMERNVWTKASNDSAGLKNYYDQHKNKYQWNVSADAILFSTSNEKTAKEATGRLRAGKNWHQLADDNSQLQADSGRYELTQLPVKPNTELNAGVITEPVVNESDGTASFVKILKVYPPNQQRSFEEARGLVINDYQNFLEEKWIEQLKKKYPVKVNEKVFQSL